MLTRIDMYVVNAAEIVYGMNIMFQCYFSFVSNIICYETALCSLFISEKRLYLFEANPLKTKLKIVETLE